MRRRWVFMLALSASVLTPLSTGLSGPREHPPGAFHVMSDDSLRRVRVWVVDVEPGFWRIPAVLLGVEDARVAPEQFLPFLHTEGHERLYWRFPEQYLHADVRLSEMRALLEGLNTIPSFVGGDESGGVSVAIAGIFGTDTLGYEAVLGASAIDSLYRTIFDVFRRNEVAVCAFARTVPRTMLPAFGPTDVTSRVSVRFDPVRLESPSGRYITTLRIRNESNSRVPGPIIVPLTLESSVSLADAGGRTCLVVPQRAPYVSFAPSGLAPGSEASAVVRFSVSDHTPVRPRASRVYAGPGLP